MQLTWSVLLALSHHCAPQVHWETMTAVVLVETGGYAHSIYDNTVKKSYKLEKKDDAIQLAKSLLDKGHNLDLGLAQINSKNLRWLGLSVENAFDACKNLSASSKVLNANYERALSVGYGPGQPALQAAVSAYNTGSMTRGRKYVQRFLFAARSPWPLQAFLTES